MQPPFHAEAMTVAEVLGGPHQLVVPDYQRAFSWTEEEAGQLLDDLLVAMEAADDPEADYFLGTLVLMETTGSLADPGGSASEVRYEIVDGLQRLVTLTILLAVLRDLAGNDDPSTATTAQCCIVPAAEPGASDAPRPQLELTIDVQDFFRAFVQEPDATAAMPERDELSAPEERLLAVREHLLSRLVDESSELVRELVDFLRARCHCAVITTRTLDRAHRIFAVINDRGLPLSRGDILKAQVLGAIAPERREEPARRWREAEIALGGSFDELFSHVRTIEGRPRGRILEEIRAILARSGDAEAFLDRVMFPYAAILATLRRHGPAEAALSPEIRIALTYLEWLGGHDWMPPLMLYWRLVDGDQQMLMPFVRRLDRLAYGLKILGLGQDKRLIRYRALTDAIRAGRLDEPGSPVDLSRDEMRLVAHNLRALHVRGQLACKLVLLRLEDWMAGAPQGHEPANLTVEHVLPQKPSRKSQWRLWFPSADEREQCTHSLGNLILVPRQQNEDARNLDLARKLEIYFDNGSQLPHITREIEGLSSWQPADVRKREERLLHAVSEMWNLGPTRAAGMALPKPRDDMPANAERTSRRVLMPRADRT